MMPLDVKAIRAEVRALDYVRGMPEEVADWRRADAVPPDLATQIVLKLHDHRNADRSLAITPVRNR